MSDVQEVVSRAISDALASTEGEMVVRWVSCIETIDSDGTVALWLLTNDDAKSWHNIGMLGYALQCEQARAVAQAIDA